MKRCHLIERIETNDLDSAISATTDNKVKDNDTKDTQTSSREDDEVTQSDLEKAILDLVTIRGINKSC